MHGCIDELMYRWMDGWVMDGWMNGWMDWMGWMDDG